MLWLKEISIPLQLVVERDVHAVVMPIIHIIDEGKATIHYTGLAVRALPHPVKLKDSNLMDCIMEHMNRIHARVYPRRENDILPLDEITSSMVTLEFIWRKSDETK